MRQLLFEFLAILNRELFILYPPGSFASANDLGLNYDHSDRLGYYDCEGWETIDTFAEDFEMLNL